MSIITNIQESAEGWRSGFSYVASRFTGVKAGTVVVQKPGQPAPVGVRYIPSSREQRFYDRIPMEVAEPDPGTPATVVERIQRSISESAEGWRMGFAHVTGKAKEAAAGAQASIQRSLTGLQMGISQAGSKVSESFGNIGGGLSSFKYPLYALVAVFLFIAVMVAIGYSGVGGPAARVAEREYVKSR